jgi:hypothetical protein
MKTYLKAQNMMAYEKKPRIYKIGIHDPKSSIK